MILPERLKRGDTIGVIAPSNPIKTTDEPQAILLSNTKEDNSVKEVSMNDVVIEDK